MTMLSELSATQELGTTLRFKRTLRETGQGLKEQLAKLHDAHAASFTQSNCFVTAVDSVVELIEAFSVVAILAPLPRSRQEGVLALERSNDDPHGVSHP
jgi:hypothetical protein